MSVCSTHYSEVTIKHTVLTNQRAHVKLSLKNTTRTLTINELKSRLTLIEGLYEIYVKFGIFAFWKNYTKSPLNKACIISIK